MGLRRECTITGKRTLMNCHQILQDGDGGSSHSTKWQREVESDEGRSGTAAGLPHPCCLPDGQGPLAQARGNGV